MPISMKDVRAHLDPDEVDYPEAQKLGPEAVPFLVELFEGHDLGLASKAVYLASLIPCSESFALLQKAAASSDPVLRVAAASSIRNLPEVDAEKMMNLLSKDADVGVRKVVLNSIAKFKSPSFKKQVLEMSKKDPESFIRDLAVSIEQKMQTEEK